MAQGQHTQPDRTDACAPHEARRNLPDQRALESATAAPPWLMREKGVVPERVAGGFNRSAPMQRIRASDRQGTVLKARRVGGVRAPGFRSTVLDTSTPQRHPGGLSCGAGRPCCACTTRHVLANPDEATSMTQDRQRKSSTSHAPEPRGEKLGVRLSVARASRRPFDMSPAASRPPDSPCHASPCLASPCHVRSWYPDRDGGF